MKITWRKRGNDHAGFVGSNRVAMIYRDSPPWGPGPVFRVYFDLPLGEVKPFIIKRRVREAKEWAEEMLNEWIRESGL